jgi:hypothetical protein
VAGPFGRTTKDFTGSSFAATAAASHRQASAVPIMAIAAE